ncbi:MULTISPECIES: hypothetical protein [unclassified Pseudodesulfovibrio]|nr:MULTISPECIES: hypothetical protein [unclassified Pseudodesulfovibrio]MCJ2165218.1 hypothetical protein [Pseudodesulfovibrio sp. S3-i]
MTDIILIAILGIAVVALLQWLSVLFVVSDTSRFNLAGAGKCRSVKGAS